MNDNKTPELPSKSLAILSIVFDCIGMGTFAYLFYSLGNRGILSDPTDLSGKLTMLDLSMFLAASIFTFGTFVMVKKANLGEENTKKLLIVISTISSVAVMFIIVQRAIHQ